MSGRAKSPGRSNVADIIERAKARKAGLPVPPVATTESPEKPLTRIPKPGRARSRPTARARSRPKAGASPGETARASESYRAARSGSKPRRAEPVAKSREASPARGAGRSTSSSRAKRAASASRKQARRVARPATPEPEPEMIYESDDDIEGIRGYYDDDRQADRVTQEASDIEDESDEEDDDEEEEEPSPIVKPRARASSTSRRHGAYAARRPVRAVAPVEVERSYYTTTEPHADDDDDDVAEEDDDEEEEEEAHPGIAVRLPFIVLVTLIFMLISALVVWQSQRPMAMLNAIDVANPVAMGLIGVLSGAIASEMNVMKPTVVKICNIIFSKA